jgi:uroporphyrin-III C-methyltransferase
MPHPVSLVGAGPGDPELLTLKALRRIQAAQTILHDRLVSPAILALASPGARLIETGKTGFGPTMPQDAIGALMVAEAQTGARVVRLKGGDPMVFARLDKELDALTAAGLAYEIVPGITTASAAAASIGQSLTKRGRNRSARLITGHDLQGYAEQDWRALARPGAVAAIYMAKKAARFLQGRLLMHGASPETAITVVENATRPEARQIPCTLGQLAAQLAQADLQGPAILLLGLAPRSQFHATQAQETA